MNKLNQIESRFDGIHKQLLGTYEAGKCLSSSSKGYERENFINNFLSDVLTPQYRFGNGDAIDTYGNKSGQLDIVIEYPYIPSIPVVGSANTRLYLAEGIACVIEVKSNIADQWNQFKQTADKLSKLKRYSRHVPGIGEPIQDKIPLFAVGYTGWKKLATMKRKLKETKVDGILIIDQPAFVSTDYPTHSYCEFQDSLLALWGFIICLHDYASTFTTKLQVIPGQYMEASLNTE